MLVGLDHAVFVFENLDKAVGSFEAGGFVVAPGGRHSTGTHNALVGLDDGSYIELLAFMQPQPDHRWFAALQFGGGLVDLCLVCTDITEQAARYEAAGIAMQPPRLMSRQRPDGVLIEWRLAIPQPPWAGLMPFLIEDVSDVKLRVPAPAEHANGVRRFSSARLIVAERSMLDRFRDGLDQEGDPIANSALGGEGLRFTVGGFALEVLTPESPTSPMAEWQVRHGTNYHSVQLGSLDPSKGSSLQGSVGTTSVTLAPLQG